ncbi:MAG: AAA family ATPase [Deltaproteobacteria bacterium]|jgi:hypothetical protein|nr:AAA family ATPase [Deltaproteobacteria bacterium]
MPKNTNKLPSALAPWNAWDGPSPYTGISRDITPTLLPLIERPEALVLTGIRRGGKSTIMFQLVEALVAQGTDRTSILYVNFDEPAIEPSLMDSEIALMTLPIRDLQSAKKCRHKRGISS